jgi:signal peptidase I
MERLTRAIILAGQAVLWILLLGFVALVAVPRLTPYEVLVVRGGSMEPEISVGSVLVIDTSARKPRVGDIVTFREPSGQVVTHRVVRAGRKGLVTRGDANAANDLGRRSESEVLGTARAWVPGLGYLVRFLQQPIVFIALLASTGGVLIIGELKANGREIRRMRRRGSEVTQGG